jgi:hypothetical protein
MKFKTKKSVVEHYWIDFLDYCIQGRKRSPFNPEYVPIEEKFWDWYIGQGPLGLKDRGLFYNNEKPEYV